MAQTFEILRRTGDNFRVASSAATPTATGNRAQQLCWNMQQLIGSAGSFRVGTHTFSASEIASMGASERVPAALQNKLDQVGGRASMLALFDDVLVAAVSTPAAGLRLDGKTVRHIGAAPGAARAETGTLALQISTGAQPSAPSGPVLPPTAKPLGGVSTGVYRLFQTPPTPPPRREPLPGVAKGARAPLPAATSEPTAWRHSAPTAPPVAAGSAEEQAYQAAMGATLSGAFAGFTLGGLLTPPPEISRPDLARLTPSAIVASEPISSADYESSVAARSPEKVFASAVKDLGALFEGAGVTLIPRPAFDLADPSNRTTFKLRFYVVQGVPPVAAPVEMIVDVQQRTLRAQTLTGHPLRGTNEWHFEDDGHGGTVIRQHSVFQMSHKAGEWVNTYLMPSAQGETWKHFHKSIANAAAADATVSP